MFLEKGLEKFEGRREKRFDGRSMAKNGSAAKYPRGCVLADLVIVAAEGSETRVG